jgi:hypothetical protein
MKMRNSLLVISLSLVAACGVLRAEDCALSGVTVARDGSPVPGIEISVVAFRAFRGSAAKTVTSGGDGIFKLANLPCGKYMVSATHRGFDDRTPAYVMVDIKKQPNVHVIVPNVDRLATMLQSPPATENGNIGSLHSSRGATVAKAGEDPEISQLRRQYFERINSSQLAAFDGAPIPEQKRMYKFAFSTYLAGIMAGDASLAGAAAEAAAPAQKRSWRATMGRRAQANESPVQPLETRRHREEDDTAKRQLANAAAIVRQKLPAEDASIFGRGPVMEQARLFLRAVSALPQHQSQCGMYSLWAVDTEDTNGGYTSTRSLAPFLDDAAAARWADLDTASKCKLVDAAAPKAIELARKIESDGSIENVRLVAQRLDPGRLGPKHTILEMFGNDGLAKYEQSKSTDEQLELYRASLIMGLCWYAAYMAL